MDKIISFDKDFSLLSDELNSTLNQADNTEKDISETTDLINDIYSKLGSITGKMPLSERYPDFLDEDVETLNILLNDLSDAELLGDFKLSVLDIVVSITAGVIASVIDIVFVGSPEIVKIYRGGENFDGSVLTKMLRQIGNGDDKLSDMLKWLSDKCKVSYDISNKTGIVYPNNHRLRSLAHDPLLGLLFAVVDIIFDTATVIDNNGHIRILAGNKKKPMVEKIFAVIFYLGHLLSDVCTSRGLPIPGFYLTQFFVNGERNESIAKIAEKMYKDGYDLRHLASMSAPVTVKNFITDVYLNLVISDSGGPIKTIAKREIQEHKISAYRNRLRLVSDAVCSGGNALKFFLPPTAGNMTALNLPVWISLLKDTIAEMKYQIRDKSVERAIYNREIINENWKKLLE